MVYLDYSKSAGPLEVYAVESGYCMEGCLMQDQVLDGIERKRIIAYVSKAFSAAERKYLMRQCANVRLNGMGEGKPLVWEEVMLGVSIRIFGEVEHKFLVLEDRQIPYYFLVGIEFLQKYGLSVDVGNEHLMIGDHNVDASS